MDTERRPWTYQDEWTLRNEFPRRPTEEVAAMLHRSVKATSARAHKLGLKKVHYGIVWTPQMLKMVKDYYPIMFNTPLAKMLGVSKRTLNRRAYGFEIKNFYKEAVELINTPRTQSLF